MQSIRQLYVVTLVVMFAALSIAADGAVKPHPAAGKFELKHDPDKPLLAFYGGIGLWQLPDGRWNGYGVTSKEQVEYLIRRCAENGIKRIYGSFQEEKYPSQLTPSLPGGQTDFVALVIELAHQNNIEIYADQPIFAHVLAKNAEFTKANPNVFTRSVSGEQDTHMLSAAYPEVRKYKRDILMEWVQNYPIDGLQLDFIRFPYYTYDLRESYGKHGYDEPLLKAFRAAYSLPDDYEPEISDPRFIAFKTEMVTQFIRELRDELNRAGVSLPIGVFNSGHYHRWDSYRTVHQDWRTWEEEALVDEHAPMFLMTHGMVNLARVTNSLLEVKRPESVVMGPIFLAEGFDTASGDVPTPDMVRDSARRLIKMGCDGLWFCRATEIEQYDLWPVVKEISQWSISEIRAQDFDPAYENLLANGGFEQDLADWHVTSTQTISTTSVSPRSGGKAASVELSADTPQELAQSAKFRSAGYHAVDSLQLSGWARAADDVRMNRPLRLVIRLRYYDGSEEELSQPIESLGSEWQPLTFAVKAKTDYAKKVLAEATCIIRFPAGSGTVEMDDVELIRDPLMKDGPVRWEARNPKPE